MFFSETNRELKKTISECVEESFWLAAWSEITSVKPEWWYVVSDWHGSAKQAALDRQTQP